MQRGFSSEVNSPDGAKRDVEAGARTFWHSHDKGQLLLVEEGRMRTQKRGEAVRELGVGQSEYAGPNVAHWHGATATTAMTHIAVQEKLNGKPVDWMEKVTDEQYRK